LSMQAHAEPLNRTTNRPRLRAQRRALVFLTVAGLAARLSSSLAQGKAAATVPVQRVVTVTNDDEKEPPHPHPRGGACRFGGRDQLQGPTGCRCIAHYSYRRATIGSRRAALRASQRPKNSPTLTATRKPEATDHSGTLEGRMSKTRTRLLSP